jgi:hypothetical protein
MLIRIAHEPGAIPDFHGGIPAMGEQLIGACLRQIVSLTLDEVNCRNMPGSVEEITSIAGHGRPFWRGALRQAARFFTIRYDTRLSHA